MRGGLGWRFWQNITDEDKRRKMIDLINILPLPRPDQVEVAQYTTPPEFKSKKFSNEFLNELKTEYFQGYKLGYADYHNCVFDNLYYQNNSDPELPIWYTKYLGNYMYPLICEWKDHSIEASEWRAKYFVNSVFINKENGNINYMQYFVTEKKHIWEVRKIEGIKGFLKKDEVIGYNMFDDDVFYLYIDTLQDPDKGEGYKNDNNGRSFLYKTIFKSQEQKNIFDELLDNINKLFSLNKREVFEIDINGNQVKTETTLLIEKYDTLQKAQAKERVLRRSYENRVAPPVPKKVETPMYEFPPLPIYNKMMPNEMMPNEMMPNEMMLFPPPSYTEL